MYWPLSNIKSWIATARFSRMLFDASFADDALTGKPLNAQCGVHWRPWPALGAVLNAKLYFLNTPRSHVGGSLQ